MTAERLSRQRRMRRKQRIKGKIGLATDQPADTDSGAVTVNRPAAGPQMTVEMPVTES